MHPSPAKVNEDQREGTTLQNPFDQQPSLSLLEMQLSTNFMPVSEEKQLNFIQALKEQPVSYFCRNMNAILNLCIANYHKLMPATVMQLVELIERNSVQIAQYHDSYGDQLALLQYLLSYMLLSDDLAEQVMALRIMQPLFSQRTLDIRLKAALYLYLLDNKDHQEGVHPNILAQLNRATPSLQNCSQLSQDEIALLLKTFV